VLVHDEELLGLSLREAADAADEANLRLRIVSYDGKPTVGTRDLLMTRVNVEAEKGFITRIVGRG
jgi:hypothetical protein